MLNYQNDKLNGRCACFDDNGYKLECTLKNDVLDGPFSEYDEKGTLICQGEYRDGIRAKETLLSSKKAAEVAAGVGTRVATTTGAVGAASAFLGFGSPGIAAGSVAASAMSAAWTTGVGTGLVSAAQSAGALFIKAVDDNPWLLLLLLLLQWK